mmetsp:Transcript_28967/g.55473  ORF Transcript_28967/g.55473 Transcript_28967/m.55473 type:complete len:251 (+) Transcript_28967:553-1305(+)
MDSNLWRSQRTKRILQSDTAKGQHRHRGAQGHLGGKDQRRLKHIRAQVIGDQAGVTAQRRLHHRMIKRTVARGLAPHEGWEGDVGHATPFATSAAATSWNALAWGPSGWLTVIGAPPSDARRICRSRGTSAKSGISSLAASAATPPWPNTCSSCPQLEQICVLIFSIMPTIGTCSWLNMSIPLRASIRATSCGVETIIAPSTGAFCASVICTSPVPGGRSTISTSSAPHCTCVIICCSAPISIGPRQTTA